MIQQKPATSPQRVVITGSDGLIGRILLDAWRDDPRYDVVGLARKPGPYADIISDIRDLDRLVEIFRGAQAIVHMAASSAVGSSWDAVLNSNLIGAYNVFEAARQAGVEKVIFASSNHAIGMYELDNAPELYRLDDSRAWDHTAEVRPDSLYGVSKVYGEAMARYYVDCHGLKAYCLRIGGVRDPEKDPNHPDILWLSEFDDDAAKLAARRRARAVWLSERDCVQLVERCLASHLNWVLCYGISDNPRQFWDITHARDVLGYDPQDTAPEEIRPGSTW